MERWEGSSHRELEVNAHFSKARYTHTHTHLCTHSAHSHMHMCVQGSSKGVTLPQGQHDSLKEGSPKWPWF